MIKLISRGSYNLTETRHITRILSLSENGTFAWINAGEIGEILVLSSDYPRVYTLASGNYRLYKVKDEDSLTDTIHLELFTGQGNWQGYLLPTGLPTESHIRTRIIPTEEIITKSKNLKDSEAPLPISQYS